ncbi:MAG: aminotransferase class IV [Gemmatimonadetes bacterium]|nr:aminotransferase class IV [Gemmatimonadota bacterium]
MTTVYFNGNYLPQDEVRVSPEDRGFVFGDGVYEVIRSYQGQLFALDAHLARMRSGVCELAINGADVDALGDVSAELIKRNHLTAGDATVYLQITRGTAPRAHFFPDPPVRPTVYAQAGRFTPKGDPAKGIATITVPDIRWARCDIKTVQLLPNCLANQRARASGAQEALFVRDGVVLEGSHSSLFFVFGEEVRTAPKNNYILPSITRDIVLDLCRTAGIPAREAPVFTHELPRATESFLAGTTVEVMPIVRIDGWGLGDGKPGPVTRRLQELFRARTPKARG